MIAAAVAAAAADGDAGPLQVAAVVVFGFYQVGRNPCRRYE